MDYVVHSMLLIPVILIIIVWLYYIILYQRARAAARSLPATFPSLPILGNLHHMLAKSTRDKTLGFFKQAGNIVGPTCIWLGPLPVFVLSQAEDIKVVISETKSKKSGQYELLKFALGEGLLTATEDIHSITRRYINPLFQPRNLENLIPMFNESGRNLVQCLSGHVGSGEMDVSILAGKTTLMNIACLIFGAEIKINMNSNEFEVLTDLGPRIGTVFYKRLIKPWLWFEYIFKFIMKQEILEIHQIWQQFANGPLKIIERRAKHPARKSSNHLDYKDGSPAAFSLPEAFEILKDDHPGIPDEHLHHEMITLVLGGAETTKVTISSMLLAIAENTYIQELLFEEIEKVMGPSDRDVTIKDLHDMTYMDQVYKETIRKFGIIPGIFRTTKEDIKLRNCTIPADSSIIINFKGLHYNASEFPEPNIFDPERFSPEMAASMKRFAFLPFSSGSRICIGSKYAGLSVKTAVIHILKHYRLTTSMDSNNLKYRMGIGLTSHKGYKIQLHNRCCKKC